MNRGIIKGFGGSWGSGLGFLLVEDSETGNINSIPCDNGCTVRALESCFGNVIGSGHSVKDGPGFMDKEIFWEMDDMGLCLGGFAPVEELS